MESFKDIAPFYDVLMQGVPYKMWANYYYLLLSHHHLNPEKLLDVCCGTGTLSEIFTKENFKVTGFDLSASMIDEARKKAKKHQLDIQYYVQDATRFELGQKFDGAYSFFDSLNYILEPEDLGQTFHQVAKHLVAGGSFIFDLNTAYAFETKLFDQSDLDPEEEVKYQWRGDYDSQSLQIKVKMEFWYQGHYFFEEHRQRAHPEFEVKSLLRRAGFGEIKVYDSYTLDRAKKRSDRVHYVAILEKPE